MSANYDRLSGILQRAYNQAAIGKGAERHANELPFDQQPMQKVISLYGIGFALGQAAKKMQEAQRMDTDPAINELLGAINYIAGAIIALEDSRPQAANDNSVPTAILEAEQLACTHYFNGAIRCIKCGAKRENTSNG